MPIIKSAVKKMKQDQRRYAQNLRTKRALRDAVKAFEAAPDFAKFRAAQSKIDTAVKKNVLTKAAAARRLSHLAKYAKNNGVKVEKVAKKVVEKSDTKPSEKSVKVENSAKKTPAKTTKSTTKKVVKTAK